MTPADFRGPAEPNGTRPILWVLIDPVLKRLKRGAIDGFAISTGISLTTLHRRRKQLGIRLNERRRVK